MALALTLRLAMLQGCGKHVESVSTPSLLPNNLMLGSYRAAWRASRPSTTSVANWVAAAGYCDLSRDEMQLPQSL